ncbi:MAG: MATE family efflux transporter [Clostridia bacterium]
MVQGIRPLVGYNYGAGRNDRVREIVKIATITVACIMLVGTAVCLLMPGRLIGIFTSDAEIVSIGVQPSGSSVPDSSFHRRQ